MTKRPQTQVHLYLHPSEAAALKAQAKALGYPQTIVLRMLVQSLPTYVAPPTRARAHSAGARVGSEFSSNQGQNEGESDQNPLVLRPITKKEPS